jgi:hypothetical protein
MLRKFIFSVGFVFMMQIMNTFNVLASETPKEYEIKAVFLFNFTNFIRWPETVLAANDEIKLCILGNDPFGTSLDNAVTNGKGGKYQVSVQRLKFPKDDVGECHILFVSRSERDNYSKILAVVSQKPILTIGETDDFLTQGGMIEFFIENSRVRLAIALPNLRSAQLNANANLLKVAVLRG